MMSKKSFYGIVFFFFKYTKIFTRLICNMFVSTVPWFNDQAASVIHRTGAPSLWWGHSLRVYQTLPHTVPVSQTSHNHSSAPSTEPKNPDLGSALAMTGADPWSGFTGLIQTIISHVARNNKKSFHRTYMCSEWLLNSRNISCHCLKQKTTMIKTELRETLSLIKKIY